MEIDPLQIEEQSQQIKCHIRLGANGHYRKESTGEDFRPADVTG